MTQESVENDGTGPVALAPGQPVIDFLAVEVGPGCFSSGPGESFDHPHIDKTDSGTVDLACDDRDRAAFPAHVIIGGAMAEPVFVHVFPHLDGDADFPVGIGGRDAAVLQAERALAFPLGKLGVCFIGGEHETDVAAIARPAKVTFFLCHFFFVISGLG